MLTTEDIQKLTSILATKEDFASLRTDLNGFKDSTKNEFTAIRADINGFKDSTKKEFASLKSEISDLRDYSEREFISLKAEVREIKEEVGGLRESLQGMIVAVDGLTKVISDLRMEYTAITYQLKRHEDWIRQIATKTGVNLVS